MMDGSEAFEQIQIIPEHVEHTAMATPDGTLVSLVIQQGDCNGPATFQASMCRLFAPCIGRWMNVYLDNIIIYSKTLEERMAHVK